MIAVMSSTHDENFPFKALIISSVKAAWREYNLQF